MKSHWLDENDPAKDEHNYELLIDTEGEQQEIQHITQMMIEEFNWKYSNYRKEHTPTVEVVEKKIRPLLIAMRKDLNIRNNLIMEGE